MGYRFELVNQKATSMSYPSALKIVGDYVYVVGENVERYKINRADSSFGVVETLASGLSYNATCVNSDGRKLLVGAHSKLYEFDLNNIGEYSEYGLDVDGKRLLNVFPDLYGDVHISRGYSDYKSTQYGDVHRKTGDQYIKLTDYDVFYAPYCVYNDLIVTRYGNNSRGSGNVRIYRWDGSDKTLLCDTNDIVSRGYSWPVVRGDKLFCMSGYYENYFDIFDITDPTAPVLLQNKTGDYAFWAIATDGNTLFCVGDDGLFVYGISSNGEESLLNNAVTNSDANRYVLDIDHQYAVWLAGNEIQLCRRALIAQVVFPNGSGGTAPFHLTARAI